MRTRILIVALWAAAVLVGILEAGRDFGLTILVAALSLGFAGLFVWLRHRPTS